jgi:hypothetical protein
MQYLGDYNEDDVVHFLWSTNDADGASITRATNGTVQVYKDNGTSQTTAGVTDTEDFDSLTGIHACSIDLSSDAFYAPGADYAVVLSGATIDGQSVNAVLAHFSIENRFEALDEIADAICDEQLSGHQGAGSVGGQLGSLPDAAAIGVQVRDDVLKRGVAYVEDAADVDSLAALILAKLHAGMVGDTLYIYKTDDATTFDTKATCKRHWAARPLSPCPSAPTNWMTTFGATATKKRKD